MPSNCPHCGKPVPEVVPKCPFCGKPKSVQAASVVQANAEAQQKTVAPPLDPRVFLAAGAEAERPIWQKMPRALHVVLLTGALPLLIPSLVFNRLQAKRWGRVPLSFLIFDALLLLAISFSSPRLFLPFAIASACSVALSLLRARHLGEGILLGYSGLVTGLLILSGLMLIIGGFMTFTLEEAGAAISGGAPHVRLEEIPHLKIDPRKNLMIIDAAPPIWEDRLVRFERFDGSEFAVAAQPLQQGAMDLWIPLEGAHGGVWLTVPPNMPSTPLKVQGWLTEAKSEDLKGLRAWFSKNSPDVELPRQIFTMQGYPDLEKPPPPPQKRDTSGILVLLLGFLFAGFSVYLATRES